MLINNHNIKVTNLDTQVIQVHHKNFGMCYQYAVGLSFCIDPKDFCVINQDKNVIILEEGAPQECVLFGTYNINPQWMEIRMMKV